VSKPIHKLVDLPNQQHSCLHAATRWILSAPGGAKLVGFGLQLTQLQQAETDEPDSANNGRTGDLSGHNDRSQGYQRAMWLYQTD